MEGVIREHYPACTYLWCLEGKGRVEPQTVLWSPGQPVFLGLVVVLFQGTFV